MGESRAANHEQSPGVAQVGEVDTQHTALPLVPVRTGKPLKMAKPLQKAATAAKPPVQQRPTAQQSTGKD